MPRGAPEAPTPPRPTAPQPELQAAIDPNDQSVRLTDSQLEGIKVEPASERTFPVEKEAVGSIDFNEDMSVQVFTPYQGRIVGLFANLGDWVTKGQTLFTIESPDLIQAEFDADRRGRRARPDEPRAHSGAGAL